MENEKKLKKSFCSALSIAENLVNEKLEYNGIPEWDSIGHMAMIAELEEVFSISMDIDDIIEFSSYKKGIEILVKYEVSIS